MNLKESIQIINDLRLFDWISQDPKESTRLIVNAIAGHLLANKTPYDLRPYIESEYVYDYFLEHGWEIDWFSILSRELIESVELNNNSIAMHINECDPMMDVSTLEKYILFWVHEWHSAAKKRLAEVMLEGEDRQIEEAIA
jgi:hypothetical protein